MKNDITDNIYFPLCCLNFDEDIKKTADLLISYSTVEFANKLENSIELIDSDYDRIEKFIQKNSLGYVNEDNYYIILSAIKLRITFPSLSGIKKEHSEINNYVRSFEFKHGKDSKVKIHKDIIWEVRNGVFDERMFRVYSAILSIIGNKKFVRITNKRIGYRMLGFKSEDVYYKEKPKYKPLSARQIKTTTDKLSERNFYSKITYRNRLTFYSTAYRGKEFSDVLTSSIAFNKEKKEVNRILNDNLNIGVEKKRKEIREKLVAGLSPKEIKCEMELIRVG